MKKTAYTTYSSFRIADIVGGDQLEENKTCTTYSTHRRGEKCIQSLWLQERDHLGDLERWRIILKLILRK
jgi:hypothetical protein